MYVPTIMHAGVSYLSSAPRLQVPKGFEQEGASLIKKGGPTIRSLIPRRVIPAENSRAAHGPTRPLRIKAAGRSCVGMRP